MIPRYLCLLLWFDWATINGRIDIYKKEKLI